MAHGGQEVGFFLRGRSQGRGRVEQLALRRTDAARDGQGGRQEEQRNHHHQGDPGLLQNPALVVGFCLHLAQLFGDRVLVLVDQVLQGPETDGHLPVQLPDACDGLRRAGQLLLLALVPLAQPGHQFACVGPQLGRHGVDLGGHFTHRFHVTVRNEMHFARGQGRGTRQAVAKLARGSAADHDTHQPRQPGGQQVDVLQVPGIGLRPASRRHLVDEEFCLLDDQRHLLADEQVRTFVFQGALEVAHQVMERQVDTGHQAKPEDGQDQQGPGSPGDMGGIRRFQVRTAAASAVRPGHRSRARQTAYRRKHAPRRRARTLSIVKIARRADRHSPQGSIRVSSDNLANSGANPSMIFWGSGHNLPSVMTPNCTPPP